MSAPTAPFDPRSLTRPALERAVVGLGGQAEHGRRWFRHLHLADEPDPRRVPHLGRRLGERLAACSRPDPVRLEARQPSADGSLKLRLALADGARIESVLLPEGRRLSLCVSSQAGCAVGCRFCATARMGLRRQLSAGEIVGQVAVARQVTGRPVTNVVFMGMGEPLQNWPAVRDAVEILHDPNGYNLGRLRMTVSTSGVLPLMAPVVRRARTGLALSLHGTRDAERSALIPLGRRWPLGDLMAELRRLALEEGGVVMVQYLLIEGVNDSARHARELWEWVRGFPCHVNLLAYNPVPGLDYRAPAPEAVRRFRDTLRARGARVVYRDPRGRDVAGACGQLVTA